jgi:AraC family L-rhamnose operon regulatory protein RhaS
MSEVRAIFTSSQGFFWADTCEGLRKAAAVEQVELEALARGDYPGRRFRDGELSGVRTVGYWNSQQEQSWGLPVHRNEGIELTFLENGSLDFAAQDSRYILKPNTLTITRPWQPHQVGDPNIGPCKLHWIILDVGVRRPHQEWVWPDWLLLDEEEKRRLTILLSHNEQPVLKGMDSLKSCFQEIGALVKANGKKKNTSYLAIKINELFFLLLEALKERDLPLKEQLTSHRRNVEMFLRELEKDPEHPWTIEDMARECGIGTTQYIQYVKSITNMTPSHYLNYLRVRKAERLLKERGDMSVLEIALECGFSSSQYFSSIFKRYTGKTPSSCR